MPRCIFAQLEAYRSVQLDDVVRVAKLRLTRAQRTTLFVRPSEEEHEEAA